MKFYDGPDRSLSEIASVGQRGIQSDRYTQIDTAKIDDQEIFPAGAGLPTKGIHVTPGDHKISLVFLTIPSNLSRYGKGVVIRKDIFTELKAGHSYMPAYDMVGDQVIFHLLDKGTNYNQECLGTGLNSNTPINGC